VVEPRAVVLQDDRVGQLDQFGVVHMPAQLRDLLVGDGHGLCRHRVGIGDGELLQRRERVRLLAGDGP